MHYKMWLNLFIGALALNVTTLSYANEDFAETEKVEVVIETPAEHAGETEFEESETEDDTDETEQENDE